MNKSQNLLQSLSSTFSGRCGKWGGIFAGGIFMVGFGLITFISAPYLSPQTIEKTAHPQSPDSKGLSFPPRPFSGSVKETPAINPPKTSPPDAPVSPLFPNQIDIRVLVSEQPEIWVASSTPALLKDANGKSLRSIGEGEAFASRSTSGGIQFGEWQGPTLVWVVPQNDGLVFINDRWYRGKVALIAQRGLALAVNQLGIEQYLYSVVGAEMYDNWSAEALKAQSVAARSYALAHIAEPASPYYDLGNSERWQVYKGITEETAKTLESVESTRAQILTQGDGVVVAYYASTEAIVQDAHQGIGMSQSGAQDLAVKGYGYSQILQYYYPGANLASIAQAQP
jgi:peptidoglycan hydrolase-like amidase